MAELGPGCGEGDATRRARIRRRSTRGSWASWNNKQAPGYRAADDNCAYGVGLPPQPLDDRIRRGIRGGRKMSLDS